MVEVFAVAIITTLAVISPGADFALVTRNSLVHGRFAGLMASLGIATGVQLHVLYTMLGVGLVLKESPQLFAMVELVGAIYLVYLGYTTFVSRTSPGVALMLTPGISVLQAFRTGFFTNALNPKTTLFVVSVYTQVLQPTTPFGVQVGYGLFMSAAHWLWFSLVSLFFSEDRLRARVLKHQVLVNRTIGLVMGFLGLSLAISHP